MTDDVSRNKGFAAASAWHSTRRLRDVDDALSESLRDDWESLAVATTSPEVFDPAMLTGLPEPVRRCLTHAIASGTPLRRVAVLHQHGQIKIGRWLRYDADWILAPPHGFIWAATTRLGPLSIRGFDRYTNGAGEMRWRQFGRIPFIKTLGPDVTRSATGRLAGESCFVPAAALAPGCAVEGDRRPPCRGRHRRRWPHQPGHHHGQRHRCVGPRRRTPVGSTGRQDVRRASVHRTPRRARSHLRRLHHRRDRRAGWWHCPDRCATQEFIRFTIDHASYR